MRYGDLLLKRTSGYFKSLLNAHEMVWIKIPTSWHKAFNVCRGVMYELTDIPAENILANLRDQEVIDVRKIQPGKNNEHITMRNVVLTFDRPTLPTKIEVGHLSVAVRPYVPNPLWRFRWNRFGHAAEALLVARGAGSRSTRQKNARPWPLC